MYTLCVTDGKCNSPNSFDSSTRQNYYNDTKYANYPMINVTWDDAVQFCSWAGSRLPTEAEWEKAARGTDARTYPWGNTSPSLVLSNFDNKIGDTNMVGSYPDGKSPYGVLDMAGNVWEWVSDWYGSYRSLPSLNPLGPSSGSLHMLRGGSWANDENLIRSSYRNKYHGDTAVDRIGFRCAKSMP